MTKIDKNSKQASLGFGVLDFRDLTVSLFRISKFGFRILEQTRKYNELRFFAKAHWDERNERTLHEDGDRRGP